MVETLYLEDVFTNIEGDSLFTVEVVFTNIEEGRIYRAYSPTLKKTVYLEDVFTSIGGDSVFRRRIHQH